MKRIRQRGATLMIALTLLSLILLLGAAATSLLLLAEHAARNHAEHAQAHLAAQATLADACLDLRQGRAPHDDPAPAPTGCRSDPAGVGWCLDGRTAAPGTARSCMDRKRSGPATASSRDVACPPCPA